MVFLSKVISIFNAGCREYEQFARGHDRRPTYIYLILLSTSLFDENVTVAIGPKKIDIRETHEFGDKQLLAFQR